jgi:hypothetical protein
MHCTCCHHALTGGIDTYGDADMPLCQACHLSLLREWLQSYVPLFECTYGAYGMVRCGADKEKDA